MGVSVSFLGRFSHDMDPNFSILVSSRGYIEIDQSIEFQWGRFVHSDGLLISAHYSSILLGSTWTPPYLFQLHFQDSLTQTGTIFVG